MQMPLAEVSFRALAPGAHEPVVQSSTDGGTDQRNHASRPLLDHFSAGPRGNTLNHARHELVDHFLLQEFAADVDARGAGGGNPEFGDFMVGVELKTIYQAQLLDGAHGDRRQYTEIGENSDQPAQAEAGSLDSGEFHSRS